MKFDRQENDIVREDKSKERILYTFEFSNYLCSVVQINAQYAIKFFELHSLNKTSLNL